MQKKHDFRFQRRDIIDGSVKSMKWQHQWQNRTERELWIRVVTLFCHKNRRAIFIIYYELAIYYRWLDRIHDKMSVEYACEKIRIKTFALVRSNHVEARREFRYQPIGHRRRVEINDDRSGEKKHVVADEAKRGRAHWRRAEAKNDWGRGTRGSHPHPTRVPAPRLEGVAVEVYALRIPQSNRQP